MRNKQKGINIRVDDKEKAILVRKAKKCRLSLSAYLRKCGLEQQIVEVPNEKFTTIYTSINELKFKITELDKDRILKRLEEMLAQFREIYLGENSNGNSNNLIINFGRNKHTSNNKHWLIWKSKTSSTRK